MRQDEESALMRDYGAALARRSRMQLRVMGAAAAGFVVAAALNWFWAGDHSTVAAWVTWLVSGVCVGVLMVTSLLNLTTRRRLDGATYRRDVLDYGEAATSDLAEATRERDQAREELNTRRGRIRTCGYIALLFLAGGTAVYYTSDNEVAQGIGFIPAIVAMAAMVWAQRRADEPMIRYDLAESRRRHLQEQFDANTSNTSESATTSELTDREGE